MATSGTVDFTLTSRQIIKRAMSMLGIIALGENPSEDEANDAVETLNLMLKSWGVKSHLWLKTEGTTALVASQATYSIPLARRMLSVRSRRSSIDLPLIELARQEYFDLPTKTATGTPVNWYFDPQRSTRTLYLWPTASTGVASTTTLHYTYARVIEDVDSLDNEADLPQEWLETLVYNLAVRIALPYGANTHPRYNEIKETAAMLLAELSDADQEDVSIYLQPAQY